MLEAELGGPTALAQAAEVTTSAVAQWKSTGKAEQLKAAPLLKLQQKTGIRPAWVVFGTGNMYDEPRGTSFAVPAVVADAAAVMRGLAEYLQALPDVPRSMVGPALARMVENPGIHPEVAALVEALRSQSSPEKQSSGGSIPGATLSRAAAGTR